MSFYQWVRTESQRPLRDVAGAFVLSGIAVTLILGTISASVHSTQRVRPGLYALFALGIALFVISFRFASKALTEVIESALFTVRYRLCEKIQRADLYRIEQLGLTELYSRVTTETLEISNNTWSMAFAMHSAVSLAATVLYIALLSPAVFLIMAAGLAAALPIFLKRQRQNHARLEAGSVQQTALFSLLTDILDGHTEIQFRAERGDEIFDEFAARAGELRGTKLDANLINQGNYVFLTLALFVLLAINVFVLPQYVATDLAKLHALTSSILFLLNPASHLIKAAPEYAQSSFAAQQLIELEAKLDQATLTPPLPENPWGGSFSTLRARKLSFQHTPGDSEGGFKVGPVDFTIEAGQIIFIVGGNGSGKTTLLKLLTALYAPTAGTLFVDDIAVTPANAQSYREMIAAIFTDFHLFKKLYGLSGLSADRVERMLQEMQLADRTSLVGNQISNLDLSTGQRKRLAMIIALLEDRPLYVFDEWAADQDPQFRQYYYERLLPALKSRGKTVLAISHDDRYFHCADRVITMESGTIRSISGS